MDIPKIAIPAGERASVLIVDDTPSKLTALGVIVSGMALEIVTATSGEQALRQILKRDFAVILLDVNMPTMGGFETATLIRSRPRSAHTPIIFVTAEANSEAERLSGYTLGAVDFIYSPITPEILRAKVQVFVDFFYLQRQVLLHNEHLESLVAQRTAALTEEIAERKKAQDEILRLNAGLEERVRQRTEELEEKAEQLALTSQYKSEFLSNMSHELRTPLNSLLILAQLLAENDERNMSEKQIKYAKTIQGAGKDLLELINEILDLSKIESGTVTLELEDESFANVGEQVERAFRHVAQSRSLGFGVELAPGLPPSLYTDSQRLQQVLKNLLSNAFKFTQKGQVSVRIAAVESGWSVDHAGLNRAQTVIGFHVTDTGIGLPADKQKIIFEAFQQADTGTARKYGGTGLGLSISRELAWLLGGELRLAMSSPGQGSTFALYLPLRAPELGQGRTSFALEAARPDPAAQEAPQASMPQETIHQPSAVADDRAVIKPGERTLLIIEDDADFADSLAGKKVLVVDDDVLHIFLLTALLERHKMAVLVAENGSTALDALGKNPDVDIVLMDIMMPEMDGFETMRQIRQMKQFESLPMIALTARIMKGDREKCIEAGASDYVGKPVDAEQLLSLLRVWLYR